MHTSPIHQVGVPGVASLLEHALSLGVFRRRGQYDYDTAVCGVCGKSISHGHHEISFLFPVAVSIKGVDFPYDLTSDNGCLCIPCLIKVVAQFPDSRALREIGEYARARYERDKDTVYVPQAVESDPVDTAKKPQ